MVAKAKLQNRVSWISELLCKYISKQAETPAIDFFFFYIPQSQSKQEEDQGSTQVEFARFWAVASRLSSKKQSGRGFCWDSFLTRTADADGPGMLNETPLTSASCALRPSPSFSSLFVLRSSRRP